MRIESRETSTEFIELEQRAFPNPFECLALFIEKIWNFIFCCCPCTCGTDLRNYNIQLNREIQDIEASATEIHIEVTQGIAESRARLNAELEAGKAHHSEVRQRIAESRAS